MPTPFDFANDPALAGIGDVMQRAANRTDAQMALYDAGYSLLSRAYAEAGQ